MAQDAKPEQAGPVEGRTANTLQHGEPVLKVLESLADAPRCRLPEDPWVELVELRKGAGTNLIVTYCLDSKSPKSFWIVQKCARGRVVAEVTDRAVRPLEFMGGGGFFPQVRELDDRGTRELEIPSTGERIEVWFEFGTTPSTTQAFSPRPAVFGRKISHSLTLGDVGLKTYARNWTAAETAAFNDEQSVSAAPPPLPAKFASMTPATKALRPGMPIKVVDRGAWIDAELLGAGDAGVFASRNGFANERSPRKYPYDRCCISEETLAKGESAPDSFRPSVRVFPNSGFKIPDDSQPLDASLKLLPGVSLYGSTGKDVTYIATLADGMLIVRQDDQPGITVTGPPIDFSIKADFVARLAEPDAAKSFASRHDYMLAISDQEAELRETADELRQTMQRRDYDGAKAVVSLPPGGFVPVPSKIVMTPGIPVLSRRNSRLCAGVVSCESKSGRVDVRWFAPGYPQQQRQGRQQLYIREEAEKELLTDAVDATSERLRRFQLVLETTQVNHAINPLLKDELALSPEEIAIFSRGAHRTAIDHEWPLQKARSIQYQLIAEGGAVELREQMKP